jgi:proton-translocating NADH-quinone oxidoreductase chain M
MKALFYVWVTILLMVLCVNSLARKEAFRNYFQSTSVFSGYTYEEFISAFSLSLFYLGFITALVAYVSIDNTQLLPVLDNAGLSTRWFYLDHITILFTILLFFLFLLCSVSFTYSYYQLDALRLSYSFFSNAYFLTLYSENRQEEQSQSTFMSLLAILGVCLLFVFSTCDLVVFYMFFEGSMVPLFFMIGIFGPRSNRIRAAYLLLLFTLFGSIFFGTGVFLLVFNIGTGHFAEIKDCMLMLSPELKKFLWVLFFIPVAIKIPTFPFHKWLTEAHTEASTEGSVLLAGLLLKLSFFSAVRIVIPFFFEETNYFFAPVCAVFLMTMLYMAISIFVQVDMKKIIAYSSVVHMNFGFLGLFTLSSNGLVGGTYLMFSHGVVSSGLFLLVGFLYARFGTRTVWYYSGLEAVSPFLSFVGLILFLANSGFPGLGGFMAEILVLSAICERSLEFGVLCGAGLFLSTAYSLLLYVRLFFGPVNARGVFLGTKGFSVSSTEVSIMLAVLIHVLLLGLLSHVFMEGLSFWALCLLVT